MNRNEASFSETTEAVESINERWWLALVDDFRTFRIEGASLNLNEFIAA